MSQNPYFTRRFSASGTKLDIGCGKKCQPGYVGIDVQDFGQPVLWDVREGLPFPDNSITAIYTSHFVEHLTDAENAGLFQEILRVCHPGAVVTVHCPHHSSREAYFHNHLSMWSFRRIEGMALGFSGSASRYGGKFFAVVSALQSGIELRSVLKVEKI